MGTIKDRNSIDLTEEEIKKRWQEHTEELYQKSLNDPDNHEAVITHPEPDIRECEIKWALVGITMNKASGGDGIPPEVLKIVKNGAVKVLHSICQQIWKTQQWPQDWKRSVFIPIPKKGSIVTSAGSQRKQGHSRKTSTSASLTALKPLTVWITTNWKILKEMGIPDHLTCLLRNLHADQEAAIRTGHGTIDWFKIGKGVCQGCILSPCLFNLYTEYIL